MNIIDAALDRILEVLTEALVDNIAVDDISRAGVVQRGIIQDDPDPETARISVTIHENDPDAVWGPGGTSSLSSPWDDDIAETECGGTVIWNRRFTVKARCLLTTTQEDADETRSIATTIRGRIERALLRASWNGVTDDDTGEYVSRGVIGESMRGEMIQGGGPPDAYDYFIKVRFDIQTTAGVN